MYMMYMSVLSACMPVQHMNPVPTEVREEYWMP